MVIHQMEGKKKLKIKFEGFKMKLCTKKTAGGEDWKSALKLS